MSSGAWTVRSLNVRVLALLALCLTLSLVVPRGVGAAVPGQPDPAANPVLASFMKMGFKLYYMGTRAGVDGWFIVSQQQQVQMAYSLPDGKHALIGVLRGPSGEDVTATQVQALLSTNKDVSSVFLNAMGKPANVADAAASSSSSTSSQGDRLMGDLDKAAGVDLGKADAPKLLMIVDPGCPHCKAVWRALRDDVMHDRLHIRLIPIAAKDTARENEAAQLLHTVDPLKAWDDHVSAGVAAGDKGPLAGKPDQAMLDAVRANSVVVDSWHIAMTPYLVYRGKDGTVKIVQGEPKDLAAVLADLGVQR